MGEREIEREGEGGGGRREGERERGEGGEGERVGERERDRRGGRGGNNTGRDMRGK